MHSSSGSTIGSCIPKCSDASATFCSTDCAAACNESQRCFNSSVCATRSTSFIGKDFCLSSGMALSINRAADMASRLLAANREAIHRSPLQRASFKASCIIPESRTWSTNQSQPHCPRHPAELQEQNCNTPTQLHQHNYVISSFFTKSSIEEKSALPEISCEGLHRTLCRCNGIGDTMYCSLTYICSIATDCSVRLAATTCTHSPVQC